MIDETQRVMLIPKIREGIVIDHIPAGDGVKVLAAIRIYPGMDEVVLTLGLNYGSTKLGRKDMIKMAATDLPEEILDHISLIAPGVSIKGIHDYQVDKRFVIELPELIENKLRCRNPNCVTNFERGVETLFNCIDINNRHFKCSHCERIFRLDELELLNPLL